jgi:poly-gamma-glutamate capsule biosynthesis protein CapA/YwtB (metallophosphatase superfamily)
LKDVMTFVATGDSFIIDRLPPSKGQEFQRIKDIISKSDVCFTNFEVTTLGNEGFPSAFNFGGWALESTDVLKDIDAYGFNLVSIANNHTLDYSYGGLDATERSLKRYGLVYAGAGRNLAEASDPKYLNTSSGRVGFIAATSTFHESWIAGQQRRDMVGRPGINPLRFESIHRVSKSRLEQLREIAKIVDINALYDLHVEEGFELPPPPNMFKFGQYLFAEGEPEGLITRPCPTDMKRILSAVSEANRQAGEVIVSIHSHEMKGTDKNKPAEFLTEFARACIDEGASAVIGHGPHVLRGIEIYKGRPIFYSLGNFIFHGDLVVTLPSDMYEKYGLGPMDNTADLVDAMYKNDTIGLGVNPLVWESVIASWVTEKKKLVEMTLYPIELGFNVPRYKQGWPKLSDNIQILERLRELSEPYGTKITIEGNCGKLKL